MPKPARNLVRGGTDPVEHRLAESTARKRVTEGAFHLVAQNWLDFKRREWADETYRKVGFVVRADGAALTLRGVVPRHKKGHIPAATKPTDIAQLVPAVDAYKSPIVATCKRPTIEQRLTMIVAGSCRNGPTIY